MRKPSRYRYGRCFDLITTMTTDSSMEWVRRAGDFRVLVGKRDGLGQALGEDDEARLAELSRYFLTEEEARGRLPWAYRDKVRAAVAIAVEVGSSAGEARNISPDGVYVVTEQPLPVGTQTVVRVSDTPLVHDNEDVDATYEQWQFAAEVVRVEGGGMGMRFIGIPLALRISNRHPEVPLPAALEMVAEPETSDDDDDGDPAPLPGSDQHHHVAA
jgi:hypothetical protein